MESSLLNYNFTPVIIPNQDDSFKTLEKTKVPRKFRFSPEKKVLTYQIEWLKSFGFNDIYIVFDITIENDVHSCIEGYTDSVKLISEDYLSGNVDALKIVKNMISTDLIVLAGEILLDVDLYQVIDQYKICDGILTIVLEEVNVEFKQRLKTNEVPVYALSNEKELLFTDHFYNEQGIHISKPLLSKYFVLSRNRLLDIIPIVSAQISTTHPSTSSQNTL